MRQAQTPEARRQRWDVRTVTCPACAAVAGKHCIGSRGQKRYASHSVRWAAYRENKAPDA